jgi:hypothetical protein
MGPVSITGGVSAPKACRASRFRDMEEAAAQLNDTCRLIERGPRPLCPTDCRRALAKVSGES